MLDSQKTPKINDLRKEFSRTPNDLMPYILGVNCYQFILGVKTVALTLAEDDNGLIMVFHPPNPGFSENLDLSDADNFDEFKSNVRQGCISDGLIDAGASCPEPKEGHNIARLLFSEQEQDFHFESLNKEAGWDWKTLADRPMSRNRDEPAVSYSVDRYFYVPDNMRKKNLQPECDDFIFVDGEGRRPDIKIMQTTKHNLPCFLVPYTPDDDFILATQADGSKPHILPVADIPASAINHIFDIRKQTEDHTAG